MKNPESGQGMMQRFLPMLCSFLFVSFFGTNAMAEKYDVDVIQDNGDPGNRVDMVIMGDGYRTEDQQKLTDDVNAFLSDFWGESPYGVYKDYFNVKLVHVISNQNGADNGSYGPDRDTALGAYYNCNNIDRLICVDTSAVFSAARDNVPEYDYIFVIVNDTKYGGSGGSAAVFSTNSMASEIAKHEFGHTLGKLTDEYEDPYPGYPACGADCPEPNATTKTERSEIKWSAWIDQSTPLPTPETSSYASAVGIFEGCRYQSKGVYRPKLTCKMRALNSPFCEVCKEALALHIYNKVDPIDWVKPENDPIINTEDVVEFQVAHPVPGTGSMDVEWLIDGKQYASAKDKIQVKGTDLGPGGHKVEVIVSDMSSLIRNDPMRVSSSGHEWNVTVTGLNETMDSEPDAEIEEGKENKREKNEDEDALEMDALEVERDPAVEDRIDMVDETKPESEKDPAVENRIDIMEMEESGCTPGSRICDGSSRFLVCKDDGSGYETGGECANGETCYQGRCVKQSTDKNDDSGCGCAMSGESLGFGWMALAGLCLIFFKRMNVSR
ncbi:MAG: hypothetical protein GXP49_11820 [Deltaproteobacteria bacterium]|nr:hypothetical protein [Deltaproteobacteria bacterium]